MTCIVGVEHGGVAYIGGDSAGVGSNILDIRADEKVFSSCGFVYGFTASFRMGQLLRYAFVPPQQNSKDDVAYLVTDYMKAVRDCFKEHGFDGAATFIVGYHGKLYQVYADFQVGQSQHGYAAVGSGYEVALGSLHSTQAEKDPKVRVLAALEAAATFVTSVQGPFVVRSDTPG